MRPARRLALVTAAALACPLPLAHAIWVRDGTSPYRAEAPLQFELEVGGFLYLRVGSAGATIDSVRFDLGAAGSAAVPVVTGSGQPIAAIAGGTVPVEVRGNRGSISLSATYGGAGLADGAGNLIGYDQILVASDNSGLPTPVLGATGASTVNVAANAHSGLVTRQLANWTYTWANTVVPPSGIYRGLLTYTASMP